MSFNKVDIGEGNYGYQLGSPSSNAIIVIQEWWGVEETVKLHAEKIKNETGFQVLIPDLYKGKVGVNAEEAHHLMGNLDFPRAVNEIIETVKYLKNKGAQKVGVIGFCMGGALAFAAAEKAGVAGAVPCYGFNPQICTPENITIPVLALFGKLDTHKGFADYDTAKLVEERLKKAKAKTEVKIYDDAGHGFLNAIFPKEGIPKIKMIDQPIAGEATLKDAYSSLTSFFKTNL